LTGTPYTAAGGGGTAGTPLTITFNVVNQPVAARMEMAGQAAALSLVTNSLTAFPNPFQESVQLKIEAAEAEVYDIRVYDHVGRLQFRDKFTPVSPGADVHTLDFTKGSSRQPGVYLLVVENERRTIRKVIKVFKTR
jgi:hypothetical protein